MAKAAKKANKPRAKGYDPKLKIDGSFEDVIGLSVDFTPEGKKKAAPKKKAKK